jgi:hydrogenase maturation protease
VAADTEQGAATGQAGGASSRVLVLGYGNTLRRDDGVGAVVAERMAADARFAGVVVRAAYQLLPEMALDFAEQDLVIFVDADLRAAPGAIEVRWLDADPPRSDADARAEPGASSHHVGGGELVALAEQLTGHRPAAAAVGIGVVDLELGEGLSPTVEAAVPAAVEAVLALMTARPGRDADGPSGGAAR